MPKPRATAVLERERKTGTWAVRITLPDRTSFWARVGTKQKVVYDNPERVPTHLRDIIVPPLINEAKLRNMRGE